MSPRTVPYPPSPTDVPADLTALPRSYVRQQSILLAGLFVFLICYVGMVVLLALLSVWCYLTVATEPALKITGIVLCSTFFLFLVKGFFKRPPVNKEMHIEITARDHPLLFAFIDRLCEELQAPRPNKVFVSPDVNAAVIPRTSLVNLFVEPKKDLLIGLGLVNCLNLSEFKSVLAHEFGHFSQSALATSYAYVAHRIIADLIDGEDWFDRFIAWCQRMPSLIGLFGITVGACLWAGRRVLWWVYRLMTLQRLAVMREAEFHADLLAVKAAGSDAVVHSLFRLRFGNLCLQQALDDLVPAARDHKLYSNDIFLHQDRAAAVVRRKRKDPRLGIPPPHDHPYAGQAIRLFDPADEHLYYDDIPEMRRTHPPAHELEENAKAVFIPAAADHRSPWILFANPARLRATLSYKFYRMVFNIPPGTPLTDARKVQEYIDHEHAETTYDPKYQGVYDDRPLEPGDLGELEAAARDRPWPAEQIETTLRTLYDDCRDHAERHLELHRQLRQLTDAYTRKPSKKLRARIEAVERELDENWQWFRAFDRRVYLIHVQMAEAVDPQLRAELVERYRFQLVVQRLYQQARTHFDRAESHLNTLAAALRGETKVSPNYANEVIGVLRAAWKALRSIVEEARAVHLPALRNFTEGERLADVILDGPVVPEPPLSEIQGAWVEKLMNQLLDVKNRCFRLHYKSVGGILALQERVAAGWLAARDGKPDGTALLAGSESPSGLAGEPGRAAEPIPPPTGQADTPNPADTPTAARSSGRGVSPGARPAPPSSGPHDRPPALDADSNLD